MLIDSITKGASATAFRSQHRSWPVCGLLLWGLLVLPWATANAFPDSVELGQLASGGGHVFQGALPGGELGAGVQFIGDINGDGLEDWAVGAFGAAPGGTTTGAAYVIFGKPDVTAWPEGPADLDGSNGFQIHGEMADDYFGRSLSPAGDFNGDGIDDLVVGAPGMDVNGSASGGVYIIYGRNDGFDPVLQASAIDDGDGVLILGEEAFSLTGNTTDGGLDINADGFDDIVIGSTASANGMASAGKVYVVFGSGTGPASPLQVSSLDGVSGFTVGGANLGAELGFGISLAEDVNGDAVPDLIIGVPGLEVAGERTGGAYVVFGRADGFPAVLDAASLDGERGFALQGEQDQDSAGFAVSRAGDINGDGIVDIAVSAVGANFSFPRAGRVYVVLGRSEEFVSPLNLGALDGNAGFILDGEDEQQLFGATLSDVGDVNGDGLDDLGIGSFWDDPNGVESGSVHVLFGNDQEVPAVRSAADLEGDTGFRILGDSAGDRTGIGLDGAVDINGDGTDDMIVGASRFDGTAVEDAGRGVVVYGQPIPLPVPGPGWSALAVLVCLLAFLGMRKARCVGEIKLRV